MANAPRFMNKYTTHVEAPARRLLRGRRPGCVPAKWTAAATGIIM